MGVELYKIDPAHSNIGFQVTHMMLARVSGYFEQYEARIKISDRYFETAEIKFTAQAGSINTGHEERDNHLRSADFFDADLHKEVSFVSSAIERVGDHRYKIEGFLTMHGLTNHIVLDAIRSSFIADEEGKSRFALRITGKLNRSKWDMKWNKPLQTGGILVSKEVSLAIESEFVV